MQYVVAFSIKRGKKKHISFSGSSVPEAMDMWGTKFLDPVWKQSNRVFEYSTLNFSINTCEVGLQMLAMISNKSATRSEKVHSTYIFMKPDPVRMWDKSSIIWNSAWSLNPTYRVYVTAVFFFCYWATLIYPVVFSDRSFGALIMCTSVG